MNKSIPKFPKFGKLSKSHANEIREFISLFASYSDFNFTSLYCWNLNGETRLSYLNENLVIMLRDYTDNKKIYSFLGNKNVDITINTLLNKTNSLALVPEIVVNNIRKPNEFEIIEDVDSNDYILSLRKLSAYEGKKFKDKRNGNNRGRRLYKEIVFENCKFDDAFKISVNKLLNSWKKKKKNLYQEYRDLGFDDLSKSINKTFEIGDCKFLKAMQLRINGKFAGFVIYESVGVGYITAHFINGNTVDFSYIYEILYNEIGKHFSKLGFKFMNIEQDLGIPYMRKTKMKWNPDHFLKKYTIKR